MPRLRVTESKEPNLSALNELVEDECKDHRQRTVSEIEDPRRSICEDESERGQGVDTPDDSPQEKRR